MVAVRNCQLVLMTTRVLRLEALVERDVHHPAEQLWDESRVLALALGLGADRAGGAELHLPVYRLAPTLTVARAWRADVHVRVPLRETEGDAGVELVRRRVLAGDVHGADERIATIRPTLVQE